MAILWIAIAAAGFAAAAYFGWRRWFRNSEVNIVADAMTYCGAVAEIVAYLDDPGITDFMAGLGISPSALFFIGIVIRLARRFRDQTMAITRPYEEEA